MMSSYFLEKKIMVIMNTDDYIDLKKNWSLYIFSTYNFNACFSAKKDNTENDVVQSHLTAIRKE